MLSSYDKITVFVDRDGTLNQDSGYITSPEGLILFPGVVEGIARLNQSGIRVVLVTNQSAIARGLMSIDDLHMIHDKLRRELQKGGAWLDGIFFCPHHPDDGCQCRKPKTGLIAQAMKEIDLNVSRSYLVGDKIIDLELANAVGSTAILVRTSEFSQDAVNAIEKHRVQVGFVAPSFWEGVDWIMRDASNQDWGLRALGTH